MDQPANSTDVAWDAWESHPAVRSAALEWIRRVTAPSFTPDERLYSLIHHEPEEAFMIVLALVQLIDSESAFYSFAAGPLEDFIAVNGPAYIDRIQKLAMCHGRLRMALGGVWKGSIRNDVWRRVEALAEKPNRVRKIN